MGDDDVWFKIQLYFTIIFTAELAIKFYMATDYRKMLKDPHTIVDIMATVPFYLERISKEGFGQTYIVRIFRVMRVLRLLRAGNIRRYTIVLMQCRPALQILMYFTLLASLLAGTVIFE